MQLKKFPDIPVSETPSFPAQLNLNPFSAPDIDIRVDSPAFFRDEGRLPYFTWKGMLTSPAHLERRLVST